MDTLDVIFRADRSGDFKGEVTAVFPSLLADHRGSFTVYGSGGHGGGSLRWYRDTRPATEEEYSSLLRTLRHIYEEDEDEPVQLRVVKKMAPRHHEERRAQLRRYLASMKEGS